MFVCETAIVTPNSTVTRAGLQEVFFVIFPVFVVIKPENLCFASRLGLEVNPLGVYPLGLRSSSCGPIKGHHSPESLYMPTAAEFNTLSVDKLARIPELRKPHTDVSSATE